MLRDTNRESGIKHRDGSFGSRTKSTATAAPALAALMALVLLGLPANAGAGSQLLKTYQSLKNIEKSFPFPAFRRTAEVGTIYPGSNAPNPSKFYRVIGGGIHSTMKEPCPQRFFWKPAVYALSKPDPARPGEVNYPVEDETSPFTQNGCHGNTVRIDALDVALRVRVSPANAGGVTAVVEKITYQEPNQTAGQSAGVPPVWGKQVVLYDPAKHAPMPVKRNGDILEVDVGGRAFPRDFDVQWRVMAGGDPGGWKVVNITTHVRRPPLVGVGVFTLPAVPWAIVYEPPQDQGKLNTATYSHSKSIGTTIRAGFSKEESNTVPVTPKFGNLMQVKGMIGKLASAASLVPKFGSAIAGGLKVFAGLLGSSSATQTDGTSVTSDQALTIESAQGEEYPTSLHKGPGAGDRMVIVRNARIAWLAEGRNMTLVLLGGTKAAPTAEDLRKIAWPTWAGANQGTAIPGARGLRVAGPFARYCPPSNRAPFDPSAPGGCLPAAGVPRAPGATPEVSNLPVGTAQALLALNPFFKGGPSAALPAPRFAFVEDYEVWGPEKHWFRKTIVQEDLQASTRFTIRIEDQSPGFLAFLGIGPQEEKHLKTSLTHSASRKIQVGEVAQTSVDFHAAKGERYKVEAYYDRVFGTFAFRRPSAGGKPALEGTLTDDKGAPKGNARVTLVLGGKRFSTRTDAAGHYRIASRWIGHGAGTLIAGGSRKNVVLRAGVTGRVNLGPARTGRVVRAAIRSSRVIRAVTGAQRGASPRTYRIVRPPIRSGRVIKAITGAQRGESARTGRVQTAARSYRVIRATGSVRLQSTARQARRLVSGALAQVSAGGGRHVWGVNRAGAIYRRAGSRWQLVPGRLRQVSAGADGTVWGVTAGGAIYRREGSRWRRMPGALIQIAVGSARNVWGVNRAGAIYRWAGRGWQHIVGRLRQVSVGANGTVWGVTAGGAVFRYRGPRRRGSPWDRMPGRLSRISVGSAGQIWGIQGTDRLVRWTGGQWQPRPGSLTQVSVAADGTAWGVDRHDRIYAVR